MIKVILFDLGGVLVELTGVPTMLTWTGKKFDEEMLWAAWLNSRAVRSFESGKTSPEQFAEQLIQEMDLPVKKTDFLDAFINWPRGLFPGVPELLNRLNNRYALACLSNSNELHWPILMEDMGLEKMISPCFSSHLMGKLKPDKDAYDYVLQYLGCKASSVLFLDDNSINVDSARTMGIHAYKVKGVNEIEQVLISAGIQM